MIRVLLADDDILALNRLLELIDWNGNGYEIVGQALGGNDCLKLLEKLRPDILILDIDMPDKNGVAVTQEIRLKKLPVKILILSNYDTFSFVRDALHNGAYDYLLKHQLTPSVLLGKLREMTELLEKEGLNTSHLSFFTTVAKQKYLNSLLRFGITNEKEHAHMLTQPDFACGNYCLSVMQITNFILITHFSPTMNREKMIDSIMTLATNIFSSLGNGLITHLEYGQFAVLFHFSGQSSTQEIHNMAHQAMRLLEGNIRKLFGLTTIALNSGIFCDISSLPRIFKETQRQLEKRPIPNTDAVSAGDGLTIQEEKELMNVLTSFNADEMEKLLKNIFSRARSSAAIPSQQLIHQLLQIGVRFQQNQKTELLCDSSETLYSPRLAQLSPEEIESFLTGYFKKIMERAPGYGSRRYSSHIQKALLFIHENYDREITLNDLAQHLHVSPTHLSRLFRKEVGTSFIDYLVSYRIERARQLIRQTDLDLKTIGERVGFHGYNYFLRAYKEKTGHTPSQDMNKGD